jgi:hypothetical protein
MRVATLLTPVTIARVQETWRAPKFPGLGASIIVIDRGNCAFTMKAYYAERAGADAVMIVDNIAETLVTMDAGDDEAGALHLCTSTKLSYCTLVGGLRRGHPPRFICDPRFELTRGLGLV